MGETKKKYPKTLEEAVTKTLSLLSNDDEEIIRKAKDEMELIGKFHYSLGRWTRNE